MEETKLWAGVVLLAWVYLLVDLGQDIVLGLIDATAHRNRTADSFHRVATSEGSPAAPPFPANGETLADAMLLRFGRRVATEKEEGRATVPRKRRGAGPDRFSAFSEEIVQEVLVRLPSRSVLRCRAVCRSWRRLASDPLFLLDHHRRQPELPLIRSSRTSDGAARPTPCLEAVLLREGDFRPVFVLPGLFRYVLGSRIHASCDGMIITDHKICNPATRQSWYLSRDPMPPFITRIIGLFRHQPSGEYRVLFWRYPIFPFAVLRPLQYCVLTVGSHSPREIKHSLTPVDGVDFALSEMGPWIFDAPVRLHRRLHMYWKAKSAHSYQWIMVFDTVTESFRHMRPPAVNPGRGAHLFDMGGTLAACTSKDGMSEITIFLLQDHKHDIWAFHYQIKLPVMDIRRFQEQGDWCAKVFSEEGDVLVSCHGQLLHCDRKGNLVANYPYDGDLPVLIPHRLKESLVQHTFFQKENN